MGQLKNGSKRPLDQLDPIHYQNFFDYAKNAKSSNSLRAYRFAWRKFNKWAESNGYSTANPPQGSHELLIGLFLASMAKEKALKPATMSAYLAGIRHYYAERRVKVNTRHAEIKNAMAGIRRELGVMQNRKKPLKTESIKLLLDSIGNDNHPIQLRDRALILLGFAGAFRRSELVGIDMEHISFDEEGVSVFLPTSKTDQEGEGRTVDIPFVGSENYCPVRTLKSWIELAGIEKGPVFLQVHKGGKVVPKRLGNRSVALVLKKRCAPFGLADEIAGHSLRAGHVTSAIQRGVPESWIMRQTGHTSPTTLLKYQRLNREYEANSAAKIGL